MIRRIICSLGTIASIISLAFISEIHITVRIAILLGGIASAVILLVGDIKANQNERVCNSEEEIKTAMKALVKAQEKVCIMSRDLSWVDTEIEACIKDKM